MAKRLSSITVIFAPYHVGVRNLAVGAGPTRLHSLGLIPTLESLGVKVREKHLEPVDDFEGEIGRSFELLRRTSVAVTEARNAGSFPIICSGNCTASVGVWAGLCGSAEYASKAPPSCVWFDAHDDFNTPDTIVSGYWDSMPLSMMAGTCWRALLKTIPGFKPLDLERLIHVGMRDVSEAERAQVHEAGVDVIWGSTEKRVDFSNELGDVLKQKKGKIDETLVHIDLDSLDPSVGRASKYLSPGGLLEEDMSGCLERVVSETVPLSLTVASFDPAFDTQDQMGMAAIRFVKSFVTSLLQKGILAPQSSE